MATATHNTFFVLLGRLNRCSFSSKYLAVFYGSTVVFFERLLLTAAYDDLTTSISSFTNFTRSENEGSQPSRSMKAEERIYLDWVL